MTGLLRKLAFGVKITVQVPQVLQRLHNSIKAHFVKQYRTQEILKTFQAAHLTELKEQPIQNWPQIQARQREEIALIKAGKLDIVDRKSWAFPFLPASIQRLSVPVMKCYSADTEILTRRGWIEISSLTGTDECASLSPTGQFEWHHPNKVFKYRYRGEMLHFCHNGVDLMVTPNHRMYGRRVIRHNRSTHGELEFLEARTVAALPRIVNGYPFQIPLSADSWRGIASPNVQVLKLKAQAEDRKATSLFNVDLLTYVRLLGIWLAEGSTSGSMYGVDVHSGKGPLVLEALAAAADTSRPAWKPRRFEGCVTTVAQAPYSPHFQEIKDLLEPLGFHYKDCSRYFQISNKALWANLHPLGNKYTKHIPQWVKELPTEYLSELVRWMIIGDGHIPGTKFQHPTRDIGGPSESFTYSTVSKKLADDLTEVLQKLGIGSVVYTKASNPVGAGPTGKVVNGFSPLYTVNCTKAKWRGIGGAVSVPYNGYVYCPSVPYGTVLVRRNGKSVWCGNSLPYQLRRMSRTPVPRRAINLIKGSFISLTWDIVPIEDITPDDHEEQEERIKIGRALFRHPNNTDSFQTFSEQCLEDFCVVGNAVAELRFTIDPERPIKMWPVNAESIRLFVAWSESLPDMPHYAQMTGLKGERGALLFYDDEMLYVKDNPATDTPFGISKMEIAFRSVNDFLGVQDMAGRAGSDTIHKSWLWWEQPQTDAAFQIVRRHIQNELEGQAKISIIGGMKKPEVLEIQPVLEADLLLNWQELLIRMIANAFDMSALALGIEHDINRAVGQVLDDKDFRSAVVPTARRFEEAFTRKILHEKLGWYDLRFSFLNLDDPDIQTKTDMNAKMYSANALTPNEWRKSIGKPELQTPFGDLTQAEMMLLNIQAQVAAQEYSANAGMQRQQDFMDRQEQKQREQEQNQPPEQPAVDQTQPAVDKGKEFPAPPEKKVIQAPQQKQGQPPPQKGGAPGDKITPGSLSRSGQPPAPKKMALPKYPVTGAATELDADGTPKYSARKIAMMPISQVTDLIMQGKLPDIPQLLHGMVTQEPGILEQMTEEMRQFFEDRLKEEQSRPQSKIKPRLLKQWAQDLGKKFAQDQKRIADMATWLSTQKPMGGPGRQNRPGYATHPLPENRSKNKPGARKPGGRPGEINPLQRW